MLVAAGVFGLSPVRNQAHSKTMLNLTLLALVPPFPPKPHPAGLVPPPLPTPLHFILLALIYPS